MIIDLDIVEKHKLTHIQTQLHIHNLYTGTIHTHVHTDIYPIHNFMMYSNLGKSTPYTQLHTYMLR